MGTVMRHSIRGTRGLLSRALAVPLYWKIVLGNAAAVGLGALAAMLLLRAPMTSAWLPAVLLLGLTSAVVVVSATVVRLALYPLDLLEDTAERVGGGELSARVPFTRLADTRTRRLAAVLNAMLDSVELARLEEREGSRRLLALAEDDRRRVARLLYDQVAQTLAWLLLQLRSARRSSGPLPSDIAEHIRHLVEEVRGLARELTPPELDEIGLRAALEAHVRALAAGRQFRIALEGDIPEERLPAATRLELFRLVEEAVEYELVRGATTVRVRFAPSLDGLEMELSADGDAGREDPADAELVAVRARARQLGCLIEVLGAGSRDERIRLTLPLG